MIASIADLVTFLRRFHRRWLDDPSLDPALIPSDLPEGLATIYRELGGLVELSDERAPFGAQDALMPLSHLKRRDGTLVFACENQGNWTARCDANATDPPVYSDAADVWQSPAKGFVEVCRSLNHFLITLCLQEAVMSCSTLLALHTKSPPSEVLKIELEPLWLNGCYVDGERDHHFFASSDGEILVMDCSGVWVGSSTCDVPSLMRDGVHYAKIH